MRLRFEKETKNFYLYVEEKPGINRLYVEKDGQPAPFIVLQVTKTFGAGEPEPKVNG